MCSKSSIKFFNFSKKIAKISFKIVKNCKFFIDFLKILNTSPAPPRGDPLTSPPLVDLSYPRKIPTGANANVLQLDT